MLLRSPARHLRFLRLNNSAYSRFPSHQCHPWPHQPSHDTAPPPPYRQGLTLHRLFLKLLWYLRPFFRNLKKMKGANIRVESLAHHDFDDQIPCVILVSSRLSNSTASALATSQPACDTSTFLITRELNQRGLRHLLPRSLITILTTWLRPTRSLRPKATNVLHNTGHSLYNNAFRGTTLLHMIPTDRHSLHYDLMISWLAYTHTPYGYIKTGSGKA
jgi:hypothetical protein